MARFIYTGFDGAADPKGTDAFGIRFPVGQAVEVTDEKVGFKLTGHPHFRAAKAKAEISDDETAPDKLDAVKAKGAKAKAEGKGRSVPPAYRSKPEEAAWLAGFDETAGEA